MAGGADVLSAQETAGQDYFGALIEFYDSFGLTSKTNTRLAEFLALVNAEAPAGHSLGDVLEVIPLKRTGDDVRRSLETAMAGDAESLIQLGYTQPQLSEVIETLVHEDTGYGKPASFSDNDSVKKQRKVMSRDFEALIEEKMKAGDRTFSLYAVGL